MIDRQVTRGVGRAAVARAPVPVLATPGAEDAGAEALPGPSAVQHVVAATVRLPGVLGAATTGTARGDAADRAELHHGSRPHTVPCLTLVTLDCRPFDIASSVCGEGDEVYSPEVLRLWDHAERHNELRADRFGRQLRTDGGREAHGERQCWTSAGVRGHAHPTEASEGTVTALCHMPTR